MLWPKKNSYKEFDNEKKFLRLENFTQLTSFATLIKLTTTNQAQCFYIRDGPLENLWENIRSREN